MRYQNTIRSTVKRYVGRTSFCSSRSNHRHAKKKVKKSNFVRFFESLENRGPLKMNGLYEKWTKNVRAQMEAAGTWPTGEQECDRATIVEYVSRLQRAFLDEFPKLIWHKTNLVWIYHTSQESEPDHFETSLKPKFDTLRIIYEKIRTKGIRDKAYLLQTWNVYTIAIECRISSGPKRWVNKWYAGILIHPYTPFNNHGYGI